MSRGAHRLSRVVLMGIVAVAFALVGCSASMPARAITEGPLQVEVSQLWITVVNTSSSPLIDVRVTVEAVAAQEFTATYGRLEPGQRRNFGYADLRNRDGTPFNRQVHRPRIVRVSASDTARQPYQVELPWR